jgi:hypothetical protein
MAKGDMQPTNSLAGSPFRSNMMGPPQQPGMGGSIGGSFNNMNPPGMQKQLAPNMPPTTIPPMGGAQPPMGSLGPSNFQELINKLMGSFQTTGPQTSSQQASAQYGMPRNRNV